MLKSKLKKSWCRIETETHQAGALRPWEVNHGLHVGRAGGGGCRRRLRKMTRTRDEHNLRVWQLLVNNASRWQALCMGIDLCLPLGKAL